MGQRYGLEIRAATVADVPGLAALLAERGRRTEAAAVAGHLERATQVGGIVLLAIEWGPPSGVIAVQTLHDLAVPRPAGLIATLFVAPDARRRGIGRLLVKAASRSARLAGCDRLLLVADDTAEGLPAFAAATGFARETAFLARPLLRRAGQGD